MTTPTFTGHGRQDFHGSQFRPEQTLQMVNAIVEGGQFANTLARQDTNMASVVFPVVDDADEPEWTSELAVIPTLGLHGDPLIVAPSRLSGIVMISRESADDGGLNLTAEVHRALQNKFSQVMDRDLLSGGGTGPVPDGLIGQAAEVTGADLWASVVKAKAEIAASGGTATHVAAAPDILAAEEARTDADGRPLWPDGLATLAGLTAVPTAGATAPLVYDSTRTILVVRSDYEALISEEFTPAFERYAVALRLSVRMAAAAPAPAMAMRRLQVGSNGSSGGNGTIAGQQAASARTGTAKTVKS